MMQRCILAASLAMLGWTWLGASPVGADAYYDEMTAACQVYGCSPDYLYAVAMCESNMDPGAVGPNGELGIFQVQPAIWGYMSTTEEIWFAAKHLTAGDVFWSCA